MTVYIIITASQTSANASISEDGMTVTIPMTTEFSPTVDEIGSHPLPLYCKVLGGRGRLGQRGLDQQSRRLRPYKVSEYVTDSHIFLEKRDYWGDYTSNIDSFEIYYYTAEARPPWPWIWRPLHRPGSGAAGDRLQPVSGWRHHRHRHHLRR